MKKNNFVSSVFLGFLLFITGCSFQNENVEVTPKRKKDHTLMVYMAADNDLESYALQNLKQMESAAFKGMNVLVLFDRAEGYDETNGNWTDTRLFEVVHDKSDSGNIKSKRLACSPLGLGVDCETELDMSNPAVLKSFIEFSKSAYPAEKYSLIIWGHGTGWRCTYSSEDNIRRGSPTTRAVAIDDRSSGYMSVSELGQAISDEGISVIGFDTCFGGVFENIYELKDDVDFAVGGAGVTPSCGWNYKTLLEQLSSCDFEACSVANIMASSSSVSCTIFECQKIENLMSSFENFSKILAASITDNESQKSVFNTLFSCKSYSYSQYPCDMYLDIFSMADLFSDYSIIELKNASEKLKKSITSAAVSKNKQNPEIGIHFIPLVAAHTASPVHSTDYLKKPDVSGQCDFIKQSEWWIPTQEGNSGSLLDKLFYKKF